MLSQLSPGEHVSLQVATSRAIGDVPAGHDMDQHLSSGNYRPSPGGTSNRRVCVAELQVASL